MSNCSDCNIFNLSLVPISARLFMQYDSSVADERLFNMFLSLWFTKVCNIFFVRATCYHEPCVFGAFHQNSIFWIISLVQDHEQSYSCLVFNLSLTKSLPPQYTAIKEMDIEWFKFVTNICLVYANCFKCVCHVIYDTPSFFSKKTFNLLKSI